MRLIADAQEPAPSLRATLAAWLLVALALLVPLAAGLQFWLTLRPALQALDHGIADVALALSDLVRTEGDGSVVFDLSPQTERSLATDRDDVIVFAVLGPDGTRLAGHPTLASLQFRREPPTHPSRLALEYGDAALGEAPVRIAVLRTACGREQRCEVRVAETVRKREQAERDAMLAAAASMLLLALLLFVALWLAIDRALRPLQRVHDQIARRSLDNLEPLADGDAPAEVRPLLAAINGLFLRLRDAAQAQQAFIADAAHQLRTPLTSLRTEAELALLEPHPPTLTPALRRLNDSAGRAARLAAQLLSLARADAPSQTPPTAVDLRDLATAAAEEWVPRALAAGVDLGFELAPAPVIGRAVLLQELLANLIHNAIEYAGRGAHVTVRTGCDAAGVLLQVDDDGPGIAPADRERVFARFERGRGAQGAGSGLGLAIVRDIAQRHGGTVTLDAAPGDRGLRVTLRLPRVAAETAAP